MVVPSCVYICMLLYEVYSSRCCEHITDSYKVPKLVALVNWPWDVIWLSLHSMYCMVIFWIFKFITLVTSTFYFRNFKLSPYKYIKVDKSSIDKCICIRKCLNSGSNFLMEYIPRTWNLYFGHFILSLITLLFFFLITFVRSLLFHFSVNTSVPRAPEQKGLVLNMCKHRFILLLHLCLIQQIVIKIELGSHMSFYYASPCIIQLAGRRRQLKVV